MTTYKSFPERIVAWQQISMMWIETGWYEAEGDLLRKNAAEYIRADLYRALQDQFNTEVFRNEAVQAALAEQLEARKEIEAEVDKLRNELDKMYFKQK